MMQSTNSDAGSSTKASDKQKVQILRKAVIELRDKTNQLETQNKQLQDENTNLKAELLQAQLDPPKSNKTNGNSSKNGYDPQVDEQMNNLNKKVRMLQEEMNVMKVNHDAQMHVMQTAYKDLENDYNNIQFKFKAITKEIDDKNKYNTQLKQNLEDLEKDMSKKIDSQHNTINQLSLRVKTYESELMQKDDEINRQFKQIEQIQFNNITLQNELQEVSGKYICFKLLMKGLIDVECLFILRQNIYGEHILEIETAQQRYTHKVSDITDFQGKEDNQFIINLKVQGKIRQDVFQSKQDSLKLCKQIGQFLKRAKQESESQKVNKAQQPQPNMNPLSGLAQIFKR
ncbi:hypothetical protein pb186bvf_003720 [Paramecium bursaria]